MTATLAVMLTAAAAAAQGSTPDAIDALLTGYNAHGLFNGAALVAAGDEVVVKRGYGWADFEWHIPATPDTRFRIGSLTKQFTAALVLELVEDGTLSLGDTIAARLPWYRRDTGARVTLHQLLNHTSGIPDYTDLPGYFQEHGRDPLPVEELASDFCSGDLEFEPGSRFHYSNSGYVILGAVIEEVTGRPFEDVLQDRILAPAGMAGTGYDHTESIIERRAAGYERTSAGLRNAPYLDMSLPHAAGALYSTIEDLFTWDRALYGTGLLSQASKRRMFTPGLGDYGYGWRIQVRPLGRQNAAATVISHQGLINGFHAIIPRIPDDRILVVLLNNTGKTELQGLSDGIVDILYGREPPRPWKEGEGDDHRLSDGPPTRHVDGPL